MAEENEIIISIQLDQEGAASEMERVRKVMMDLAEEKRKLTEAYKSGAITQEEFIEQTIRVEQNMKTAQASYKDLTKEQETNNNSINALRLSNKRLLEERNNLDISTDKGRKRLIEINAELDKNNEAIKANVSGYEKQKIGIGGYADALSKFFPFLGPVSAGIGSMKQALDSSAEGAEGANKSLWKIVMNPIGAIVTAIVAALALLYKGLTQTAGGADLLDDIMASLSAAFDVVMDRVGKVSAALVELFKGNFSESAKMMSEAVSGIGDEMSKATKSARELAAATRDLEDAEISFSIAEKEVENQIKRLILQSKNRSLSEDERMAKLKEATELEKKRVEDEIKLRDEALRIANQKAAERLNIAKQQGETEIEFGKRVLEAFQGQYAAQADDLRDKVKDMLNARQDAEGKSLTFQEKIQGQRDALEDKALEAKKKRLEQEQKDREKAYEEEQKWREVIQEQQAKKVQDEVAEQVKKNEEKKKRDEEFDAGIAAFQKQIRDKKAKDDEARDKRLAEVQIKTENFKNAALENAGNLFFAKKQGLRVATNALFKQDALKEIYITTRNAAMKAYDSMAKIPIVGPALGVAAAAATIAYGGAQAASVLGIPFARGGRVLSGQRIKSNDGASIYRSNGDNLLATVRTGEVILNERQQAMLGGDKTFKRIGVPGFASGGITGMETIDASRLNRTSIQIDEILKMFSEQRPVLVLQDFEYAASRKISADKNAIII